LYLETAAKTLRQEFEKTGARATFFVPGETLREVPEIIGTIYDDGHEIASHSHYHVPVSAEDETELRTLLSEDIHLVKSITGSVPIGFRCPYFSIERGGGWLFRMLRSLGFKYDSSVVPTWTPYWGVPSAPKVPYFPEYSDISLASHGYEFLEIPLTVWPRLSILPGLPMGGGFYMRIWPRSIYSRLMRRIVNGGDPLVIYIHPGNLESEKIRIANITLRDRMSQYFGVSRGIENLRVLMHEHDFRPINEVFRDEISKVL
jgi:peptidoglycan/xylan/chitin deacetylase (PgdA/CDA1 family)